MDYVIGLGANLGDRAGTMREALGALHAVGRTLRVSALYETVAVGPAAPAYLNAAVLIQSDLDPHAVLVRLLVIETCAGRERRRRFDPRTLDLDLLVAVGTVLDTPTLIVPHPRLRDRAFALLPLLDVLPDAEDARTGEAYALIASRVARDGILAVDGAWLVR